MLTRGTAAVAALAMGVAGLLAGVSPGQAETAQAAAKPPRPAVSKLGPTTGPVAGGTRVTVRGKNLTGARKVLFGTTKGRKVTVKNAHKLTVISPAHAAGTVHVRVVTRGGKSAKTSKDKFTFAAPVTPPPPPPPPPTAQTAPLPPDASVGSIVELNDVTCPSAGNCFAVGAYDTADLRAPLVEHLVDGVWQPVSPPVPTGADPAASQTRLVGVSCAGTDFCVAAGQYDVDGGGPLPFVETWDGTSWSVTGLFLPEADGTLGSVVSVSCSTTTLCAVVGTYQTVADEPRGLIETFADGNWFESMAPLPAGASDLFLTDVHCFGTTACVAVGNYVDSSGGQPLVERLNGPNWSAATPPLPNGSFDPAQSALNAVSCGSPNSCTAVGFVTDADGNDNGLVETFDPANVAGAQATAVPALGTGTGPSASLSDVSCRSATACVAGGISQNSDTGQRAMLVTVGAGVTPRDVSLPGGDPLNPFAQVIRTGCASSGCGGVGVYINGAGHQVGLLTRISAGAGVGQQSPQPAGAVSAFLSGLAGSSGQLGVAVGTYLTSDSVTHGLLVTNVPLS